MTTAVNSPARGTQFPVPGAPVSSAAALLPESVRLFSGLAGIGAAALSFGLSSNLIADGFGSAHAAASFAAGAVVGAWAVFLLLWAVQSLRGVPMVSVRTVGRLLSLGAAVQLASLVYGLWQLPVGGRSFNLSAACAIVLELAILASLGWLRRHTGSPSGPTAAVDTAAGLNDTSALALEPTTPAAPPAGRLLAIMFLSALLVAAVTTPGLAATTAGHHAVPHGEHGQHQPVLNDPAQHHH